MNTFTVPSSPTCAGLRALFITNECAGLGHLRRSINLARAVTERSLDSTALIVTGSSALGSFELPKRVDTVKLPVFRREADGTLYAAALGVDMSMIEALRSEILRTTAAAFEPDVVVVDKTPLGLRDLVFHVGPTAVEAFFGTSEPGLAREMREAMERADVNLLEPSAEEA